MNLKHLNAFFVIIILFSSCTAYKDVPYFQDLQKDSIFQEKITNVSRLTIQPGDMLRIHVTSLNSEQDALFNYNLEKPNSITNTPDVSTSGKINASQNEANSIVGYMVDHSGSLHLPLVGRLKVAGLNLDEATNLIEEKLQTVLKQPTVSVVIINLKVSVLGDVGRPDTYNFTDEKITLTQALAFAGDLNTTGMRHTVLLIREVDGKRTYIPIDLTSKKIFNSPYYYLKNNDIIYVTPNREKIAGNDAVIQRVSLLISALSLLAIFVTRVK